MLTLTDNAQYAIRTLVAPADEPTEAGVRIASAPGNNGSNPELSLEVVPSPAPGDQVVDEAGARVFLDAVAAEVLSEETLDVQIDAEQQQVNFFVA
jgi:iron-sulfur cluster assembly protein